MATCPLPRRLPRVYVWGLQVAVQYTIGSHLLVFRRPPANKRLSSLGLHFQEVFECLDLDNIILLFRCLLAERQVRVCQCAVSVCVHVMCVCAFCVCMVRGCELRVTRGRCGGRRHAGKVYMPGPSHPLPPGQILFHSSQLSLLTAAAEVAVAIMYPLQWPHVYIPVLPRGLVQVLQAPMPFIIGGF
jgi:hypothetical protein